MPIDAKAREVRSQARKVRSIRKDVSAALSSSARHRIDG
jgi:hypothetical protein